MNKLIYITLLLFSTLGFSQSAEEIVKKHFEITGGLENWNALSSIKIKGEVAIGISDVVPILIEHKRPYFKRVSYLIDGTEKLNEGYDGKQAYTYDESTGGYKMLMNYEPDAFETDLLNYNKKGFKLSYLGKEKINSKETYKIKLVKNTLEDIYWIDVKTYQIIKEETHTDINYYSNFKKIGELTFATRIESQPKGGMEYVIIFHDIKPNAAIAEKRFKFN